MKWYFRVLAKYAVFNGRASKQEYWMFILVNLLVAVSFLLMDFIVFGSSNGLEDGLLLDIYSLAVLLPSLAVTARRLHDTGRSGWWSLLGVIPLVMCVADGQTGPNKYGPDPLADEEDGTSAVLNPENMQNQIRQDGSSGSRVSTWKIVGIVLAAVILLPIGWFIVLASNGPELYIYLGRQVPKSYVEEVRKLSLLQPDEKIFMLYSDALYDIKDGVYFVTDRNLVLYCQDWEEPATIIPFDNIDAIEVEYNDSFFDDSWVTVEFDSEWYIAFPLSSDQGRDQDFVNYLSEKTGLEPVIYH